MKGEPLKYYLEKLEEYRIRDQGVSRRGMADDLGIPLGTYESWYRQNERRTRPSSKYGGRIKRFLRAREAISVDRFLATDGPALLTKMGFEKGLTVLDFGSGNGDYSLVLARAVGQGGKVYAVDKDKEALGVLMGRARGNRLRNIEDRFVSQQAEQPIEIPVPTASIDAMWLSDILHDGYFKEDEKKLRLLAALRRALKKNGFIAVHPIHMEAERLKWIVPRARLDLEEEYQEELLFHGTEFHEGRVLKFRKETKRKGVRGPEKKRRALRSVGKRRTAARGS